MQSRLLALTLSMLIIGISSQGPLLGQAKSKEKPKYTPQQLKLMASFEGALAKQGCELSRLKLFEKQDNKIVRSWFCGVRFPEKTNDKTFPTSINYLKKLPEMEILDLGDTEVTDKSFNLIGEIPHIKAIYADDLRISKTSIKNLAKLTDLQVLDLSFTMVDDEALEAIANAEKLEILTLNQNPGVTDAGLKKLVNLENLERLALNRTKVNWHLDGETKPFKKLRFLEVNGCRIDDQGMKSIGSIETLEELQIGMAYQYYSMEKLAKDDPRGKAIPERNNESITEAGFRELNRLKSIQKLRIYSPSLQSIPRDFGENETLKELDLSYSNLKDECLEGLANFKSLTSLKLHSQRLTLTNLESLKDLTRLEDLDIHGEKITNESIRAIGQFKNLKELDLSNTQITGNPDKVFDRLENLTSINLSASQVTDQTLLEFGSLKKLKQLTLYYCKITDAGVARLQKLIPGCMIYWKTSTGTAYKPVRPGIRMPGAKGSDRR
jgi:Leucine-rich repeat (LRR) protein